VVDRKVLHMLVVAEIRGSSELLRTVELFDVYEGPHLGEGKKSMAYHLEFGADDRTLTAEEVDGLVDGIRKGLKARFGAEAR
jgi:phenylalanyl-tRNA synthetase beta chain